MNPARWTRLVGIFITKIVDQLVRDDTAAPRERLKPINCPRFLYGERLLRSRQSTPSQFGDHLSDGFPFALSPLLRGLQDIIINVECRSHASDADASRINCPLVGCGSSTRSLSED